MAVKRFDLSWRAPSGDPRAQIEQLEADANYFWWPTDLQLEILGTAFFKRPPSPSQVAELRALMFSPGDASRDG